MAKELLYSDNWGTPLSLYVSSSDIPGIADVDGDGEVLEELVTARSTDYYYGDTVTLTPQAAEGSGFDFLEWRYWRFRSYSNSS